MGKYLNLMVALSDLIAFDGSYFSIPPVIRSKPKDLSDLISCWVTNLTFLILNLAGSFGIGCRVSC